MKKNNNKANADLDTMRSEYDFSKAARGVTSARYAKGSNIVLIDPGVMDVFPDGETVNKTLRALAPIFRQRRRAKPVPSGPALRAAR
jgi:hypothetical protein